jgi:hypothetical protein
VPALASKPLRAVNRLQAVLLHVPHYSIRGIARLAKDSGLSKVAIFRLVNQQGQPKYHIAEIVAEAISHRIGRVIPAREIFSPNGTFPTPSVCTLMKCKGCSLKGLESVVHKSRGTGATS